MNPIKNFFSKKGSISLFLGVISLLAGIGIFVIPVYANNDIPSELPEVVGDQIPFLDEIIKKDKREIHENKKAHDKKGLEKSLPQLPKVPSSPVSELPEQTEAIQSKETHPNKVEKSIDQSKELVNQKQTAQIAKDTNTASTSQGKAPVVRTENGTLPKTATNAPNGVVAGGFILLGGALIHRYYRVRNEA